MRGKVVQKNSSTRKKIKVDRRRAEIFRLLIPEKKVFCPGLGRAGGFSDCGVERTGF